MIAKLFALAGLVRDFFRALGGAEAHRAGQQDARNEDNALRNADQAAKAGENAAIAARRDDPDADVKRLRDGTF